VNPEPTNYRDILFAEMTSLARHWTGPARPILLAIPAVAELAEDFDDFLAGAAAVEKALPEDQLDALDAQLADWDTDFDRTTVGLFDLLTALAVLARDATLATALLTLRDRLIPEGKSVVNRTLLAEAAMAEGVQNRLTDADRALADRIVLLESPNLTAEIARLEGLGTNLREGEVRRAAARQLLAENAGPGGAEVLALRNQWIKLAKRLRENMSTTRRATPAQRQEVLAKLDEAQATAADRAAKRRPVTPAPTALTV